ncbi:GNAT family N-acetyltransferase [Quadrisphaera setariae]|uniref:GNAT family N-acetyltransferase n=1 Tax=Quadrisphaera setariae TaxID=2593304 RepID=A0A5C8ZHM5_9ACTN|nr:GNAT family N-acetyltransferase [Quadrisphaera setariae]TXR57565.1 GNAT family N-acetyltransferase [Quadrisphaera setariae]
MTDVVVRAARTDEAGVLLDFWARAGENAARPSDELDAVVRLVERDPEALVVAELDGRVVGTVIAGWDGWRANLYRLAVDPDVRGRGIGGLLLARAEQRLRALGAQRFCAMVLEDNGVGREFWASRGYVPQDEWRRWVKAASS